VPRKGTGLLQDTDTQKQHLAMLNFSTQLVQQPKQYMMHCAYATIAKFHEALQHDIARCPHDM